MKSWKMLTLVGEDQPGIVAKVTQTLYQRGWNLGEASMIRLGGSFSVMMMVRGEGELGSDLAHVAEEMKLHMHVDDVAGGLHRHLVPNVQVRVTGADRAGIVAQVTTRLAENGFNILELESDVAGTEEDPVYIMNIQGFTDVPLEQIESVMDSLSDIDINVSSVETLIG